MFVLYDSNGKIVNVTWGIDQFVIPEDISSLEIDEIAANKATILELFQTIPVNVHIYTVVGGMLQREGETVVIVENGDKKEMRQEFQNMIDRLDQIINATGTPTAAQMAQAIKDEALYIKRIMKRLRGMVTG